MPSRSTTVSAIPIGGRTLPALTSVRGLLAWWVVSFHLSGTAPFHLRHIPLLLTGILAVDCFFILSGFVLRHVHPTILGARGPHPVLDFLVNRLARIYPLHLFMLALFVLVVEAYRLLHGGHDPFHGFTWSALLRQLLLVHAWLYPDHIAWNVPSWSISSEWAAYLLAPVLFLAVAGLRTRGLLLVLAVCGGVVLWLLAAGLLGRPMQALPRVLLEFTAGSAMRSLLDQPVAAARLAALRVPGLLVGWALAGVAAWRGADCLFLAAMGWVLLLLALRTERATGVLGRLEAVALYLGETSFAVYMCHALVLMLWAGNLQPMLSHHASLVFLSRPLPAALLLCLVIQGFASLLHHGVERPAQRWIRGRFRARFGKPAGPAERGSGALDPAGA